MYPAQKYHLHSLSFSERANRIIVLPRLSRKNVGNGVDRAYKYDVHGWPTSNTVRLKFNLDDYSAGTLQSSLYYDSLDGSLNNGLGKDDLLNRKKYTETLLYADGLYPRYSGCPSAKETSLGGRYDYRFDAHDRLVCAEYMPSATAREDEDYYVEYTYDDLGNPRTLKRWGVIDYTSGGEATYGLLDDLTFSYPYGSSQLQSVTSAAEGTDFYGRVGFPLSGSQYTWNDAGLMTSDSGFGITAITYNDFGLPVKFHTQDRKAYTAYSYSADGALLQKEVSTSTSSPFPFTSKSETTYSAGRIFYSGTRSNPLGTYVSYFPGGYFDSNGGVHYMHLDYQGSVVMETDSTGHIEKHRGYYPYGEPWAEPTNKKTLPASVVQPQTYQSKERTAATGDYDFGPRRYISAAPFWRAPDPNAHDYPNISPYAFCAANPIRYADPTGMVFTEAAQKYADELQSYAISAFMDALRNQRFDIADKFNATLVEIKKMAESEVVFDATVDEKDPRARTTFHVASAETETDAVLFTFPKNALEGLVAHEFKHGYQFLIGETCLSTSSWKDKGRPIFYDIHDEEEAYGRSALFGDDPTSIDEIRHNSNYPEIIPGHFNLQMSSQRMKDNIKNNRYQRAVHMDGKTYYKRK